MSLTTNTAPGDGRMIPAADIAPNQMVRLADWSTFYEAICLDPQVGWNGREGCAQQVCPLGHVKILWEMGGPDSHTWIPADELVEVA